MSGDLKLGNFKYAFMAVAKIRNWPQYFLDFFNITTKKFIVYELHDGTKFNVRAKTTDRGILTSVVLKDEYKINSTKLDKPVIIDIGGQIGIFSVFAGRVASKVYTYEPTKTNYEMLCKNVKINNLQGKVFPHKNAVYSKKNQTIKIYMHENNTGGHSAYGSGEYESVKTTTLKDIFEDNKIKTCDILKLDAEGSEYEILYSTPKKYISKIKNIYLEYHDLDNKEKNHKGLLKFLKANKYKVDYSDGLMYAYRK